MKVQRDELLGALKRCMPGIERGTSLLEGADTFVFQKGWVHSYNGSISVSVPFEVDDVIEGAVRAPEFFGVISKLPSGELTILPKEKHWLIKLKKIRIEITLMEQELDGFISNLALDKVKWAKLPETFEEGLKCCQMNCQTSDSYGGVYVQGDKMTSTDGRRINLFTLKKDMPTFWIRDNSAGELLKLGSLEKCGVSESWVHFTNEEGVYFSCMRLKDENFPFEKMKKVLEKHKKKSADLSNVLPDGIDSALERASALSMEVSGFKAVKMVMRTDAVEVYSRRTAGSYSEKVLWEKPFEEEIEPVTVLIDCDSARYALSRSKSFYMRQTEKNTVRLIFFDDSFQHLIATLKQPEE